MRYDGDSNGIGGGSASGVERPAPPPRTRNTHYRSSSCDVKMMSGDESKHKRAPPVCGGHSRNNSRDLCAAGQEFRNKLTHSRNNSSDRHNTNIKYILNYLNTPKLIVPAASLMGDVSKKHTRNHSYDQIYMPQNIRIDQEFQRRFNKNVSRKNSSVSNADATVAAAAAAGAGSEPANGVHSTCTGSKDLNLMNIVLTEDSAGKSVLRHRRTGSRDLNRMGVVPPEPESMAAAAAATATTSSQNQKHVRQGSQHRIQIDGLEASDTICETDGDAFK